MVGAEQTSIISRGYAGITFENPAAGLASTPQLGNPSLYSDYLPSLQQSGQLYPNLGPSAYPPSSGFLGTPQPQVLPTGTLIDRFGAEAGSYAAPYGTSFSARSLPPAAATSPYSVYEVLKPFQVDTGPSTPWFGQPGLGTQYKLPTPVQQLRQSGYLEKVSQ